MHSRFFFFLILADSPGRFTGTLVRKGDSFKTFQGVSEVTREISRSLQVSYM